MERERQMELQHFCHEHPLYLTCDTRCIFGMFCYGCYGEICGLTYKCRECFFFLHKSCGEQPRDLKHPLHPQHPLILLRINPPDSKLCHFCDKLILFGFAYHCSDCNFNLHLKCASIRFTVKAEFHDHPLNLLRKSVSFSCDICGKEDEDKDMSYLCLTCPLMVHLKCAVLPSTVKHRSHWHPLNLTDYSQVNQSGHRICRLCVKKVDTDRVYYCSKCNFVAHLDCATREEDTDETSILENEDSELDESIDLLAYVVNKIKIGEDGIEIAEEIKHFSHEHDLKLTDELLNNEKCDGCMYPIISPPFYRCAQCRFFLHKSCAELPRKKRHPLHPHLLTLLPKPSYESGQCHVCARISINGFKYHCEKCWFYADVHCSLLSDILIHDGHEHQLFLSRAPYWEMCSCCYTQGKVFRCGEDCGFTLNVRCAMLPHTLKYRYFEQLFNLCYNTDEDSDGEYYYDSCEKERNPNHWFYYCAELSFPAHPDCILGYNPYLE